MALPTLDQYREGSTTWRREHGGVGYTLSHHGVSSYSPKGTWCFYIHLLEEQFVNAEDFAHFDREPRVTEFAGSHRESYDYDDVPDYGFHGGITFYERSAYVRRDGARQKALKIGCDYAHLWDQEGGFWEGLEDVERDAHALIDKLVRAVPLKWRCGYSGRYGLPEEFYTARNGSRVHTSHQSKFSEAEWPTWLPSDDASDGSLESQDGPFSTPGMTPDPSPFSTRGKV